MHIPHRALVALGALAVSLWLDMPADAALLGRLPLTPNGSDYQAYYDDELDITWVADANLARTSGYDTDGRMAPALAASWIFTLNAANYLGASDWRLPTILDTDGPDADDLGNDGCAGIAYTGTDCGYNVQTKSGATVYSEMAHLYYVTLGNLGRYDTNGLETGCFDPVAGFPNYCLTNTGPFANLQGNGYWTGTRFEPVFGYWWTFVFSTGIQYYSNEGSQFYAWAVRPGDIDADTDGIADGLDNCTLSPNPTQLDADDDGYGNICDADINNSGLTTATDFNLLRSMLNQPASSSTMAAAADMNGSGLVTTADFNLLRARLNTAPGPSGLHPQ